MVTIIRSALLLSAVGTAVLAGAFGTASPRAENPPASAQVEQRFPSTGETFKSMSITSYVAPKFVAARKARRPPLSESCAATPNGWPYVSEECLVASMSPRHPAFTPVVRLARSA